MDQTQWIAIALGGILAAGFIAIARFSGRAEGSVLAFGLVAAALIYLGFACVLVDPLWIRIEATGVFVSTAFVYLARKFSFAWVAVGWALHVAWDLGPHVYGGGAHVVPVGYPQSCAAFDLIVAAYVIWLLYSRPRTPPLRHEVRR